MDGLFIKVIWLILILQHLDGLEMKIVNLCSIFHLPRIILKVQVKDMKFLSIAEEKN